MPGNECRLLIWQHKVHIAFFPDKHGYRDFSGVEHLRQFDSDKAPTDNNCAVDVCAQAFDFFQVLFMVQAADAFQVFSRPRTHDGSRSCSKNQTVVGHRLAFRKDDLFVFKVNRSYFLLSPKDAVFLPKISLIGFDVLPAHMAHIDIHQGCAGEEIISFR